MYKPRTDANGYINQWEKDGNYFPWTLDMVRIYFLLYPEKSKPARINKGVSRVPTKDEQSQVCYVFNQSYSHKWGGKIKPAAVREYVANFLGGTMRHAQRSNGSLIHQINNFRKTEFDFPTFKKWGR